MFSDISMIDLKLSDIKIKPVLIGKIQYFEIEGLKVSYAFPHEGRLFLTQTKEELTKIVTYAKGDLDIFSSSIQFVAVDIVETKDV
jgi:hypothetical protein